jgi:hypothetical protein
MEQLGHLIVYRENGSWSAGAVIDDFGAQFLVPGFVAVDPA